MPKEYKAWTICYRYGLRGFGYGDFDGWALDYPTRSIYPQVSLFDLRKEKLIYESDLST